MTAPTRDTKTTVHFMMCGNKNNTERVSIKVESECRTGKVSIKTELVSVGIESEIHRLGYIKQLAVAAVWYICAVFLIK